MKSKVSGWRKAATCVGAVSLFLVGPAAVCGFFAVVAGIVQVFF